LDRPKQYTEEQLRSFDVLNSYKDAMIGLSRVAQIILGSSQAVASGFSIAAQSTPNMTLNLALGNILQNAPTDATPYGLWQPTQIRFFSMDTHQRKFYPLIPLD
jgi:hypothetical protein